MVEPGARVQSTDHFGETFPQSIRRNNGKRLTGTLLRFAKKDGLLVVKWDHAKAEQVIHPNFVEPLHVETAS